MAVQRAIRDHNRRSVTGIILLAFALRLLLYLPIGQTPLRAFHTVDSYEYDTLARNLWQHHVFSQAETPPYEPDVRRTPVYPALLAILYALTGYRPLAAVFINLLLATLNCVLTYRIGRRWLETNTARLAALLLAIDVASIVYANFLLTETLFTLLLLLAILYLIYHMERPSVKYAALSGFMMGVTTLCRPISLYLILVLGFFSMAFTGKRGWLTALRLGAVFLLGAALALVPWIYRNYHVRGIAELTTQGAINLYYQRAARILSETERIPIEEATRQLKDRLQNKVQSDHLTPADEVRLMRRWALEIIRSHFRAYIALHARGIWTMISERKSSGSEIPTPPKPKPAHPPWFYRLGQWARIFSLLVTVAALIGLWTGIQRRAYRAVGLFSVVILYFMVISGPEAYSRFRVPITPYISLLAALGLQRLKGLSSALRN